MRKSYIQMFAFLFLVSASTTVLAKEMVAIMNFDNKAQQGGWRVGNGASDMLATELVKTGAFRVMERDKIVTVMKEQNFGQSGRVDSATAARLGKILGVKYIITGAVTEYGQSRSGGGGGGVNVGKKGYHASVDIRMIDAETGEIVFADTASDSKASFNVSVFGFGGGEGFNQKHASEVMRGAIGKLSQKLSTVNLATHKVTKAKPTGAAKVADVDGNTITLNQGSNAGFKVGQVLTISKKGKVIKDPDTGDVIKVKYKTVGKIKLTEVKGSYSEGKIINGSGFKIGNRVR